MAEEHSNPDILFSPEFDLELRAINLFSGANGSGKTTILDAVRSLFEPAMLAKLRRENIRSEVVSGVRVVLDSGSQLRATFSPVGEPQDSTRPNPWNWQHTSLSVKIVDVCNVSYCRKVTGVLPVVGDVDEIYLQPFRDVLLKLGVIGKAWPSKGLSLPSIEDYVRILSRFQRFFPHNEREPAGNGPQFFANPGDLLVMDGRLHQYHGDDLGQSSRLSLDYIPSGWRQVVEFLFWMECCDDHSICIIDEPEQHLHPTLQRALIAELLLLQQRKDLQLIIATHSPTFLNRFIWGDADVALFNLLRGRPVPEPALGRIIEQLGCLASDICQANGVIWVEGPSDRIYIKAFLRAWCAAQGSLRSPPVEGVDYSFAFFGGSCLKHYGGTSKFDQGEDELVVDLIQLLSLNRNLAICMDSDNDFIIDDFGCLCPVNTFGKTKMRVARELSENGDSIIHVTDGYTMEYYVANFVSGVSIDDVSGRVRVDGSKIQVANDFSQLPDERVYSCLKNHCGLEIFVGKLDEAIKRWRCPGI